MKTKIFLAGLAILGSIELSAYTYEVQPLVGQNFTESGSAVDDSTAFGLRLNKYISDDNAIMFGYTRIIDADYNKNVTSRVIRNSRSCDVDPCAPQNNCDPKPDNYNSNDGYNDNGYNNDWDNDADENDGAVNPTEAGANNGAAENDGAAEAAEAGANSNAVEIAQPHKPTKKMTPKINNLGKSSKSASTDIDRFYINGLHNITTNYSRLTPYVYAGFGYERVEDEYNDLKSQGFFDAGLGLKFGITDRVSLLADVQGIKKFRDNDFDVLASLGLGFFFGGASQVAPEIDATDVTPQPKREITIVKVKPTTTTVVDVKPTTTTVVNIEPTAPAGNYYIQLAAAFSSDIEKGCHFTDELKKDGIDYQVKYITIKGKNASVLVTGPYATKEDAKEELFKIKKISKDAFIRTIQE
jgi:septal ring-binding cell division protein DamX